VRRAIDDARASVTAAAMAAAAAALDNEEEEEEGPLRFCLKMSAFPKSLEHTAGELLLEGGCLGGWF
jgi:hypothetical protein